MDVIIEPDEGMAGEIGRQLLRLADHPYQVHWVSWPKTGFLVPQELAAKLGKYRDGLEALDRVAEEQAPPRRRGRPRKTVDISVTDTDNAEKEE